MKKTLYALLASVALMAGMASAHAVTAPSAVVSVSAPAHEADGLAVQAQAPSKMEAVVVADGKVADPFKNTIFTIKNPGQPGFVKRGGDGGGISDKGRSPRGGVTGGLGGNPGRGGIAGRS